MPYNVNQIKQYDMVGAANRGEDRAYKMNERKRKQPILEAMDQAKLRQDAQTLKTNENNLTLQQGKINREAFNQAGKGMDLINQETANLEAKGGIPPEKIKAYRDKEISDLYNYNARTYGRQAADSFKDNPELMAKVAGGQLASGKDWVKSGTYYQEEDGQKYNIQVMTNARTGESKTIKSPIQGKGISKKFGESAEDESSREIRTKRGIDIAKESVKDAAKYANQIESIDRRANLFSEGIRLIREEGARTGAIESMMPTYRASTEQLKQLQNEMGLEVVRATTFGSLSKGELETAKDVAFPSHLDQEDLAIWMKNRASYEQKLKKAQLRFLELSNMGYSKAQIIDLINNKGYKQKRNKKTGQTAWVNSQGQILGM